MIMTVEQLSLSYGYILICLWVSLYHRYVMYIIIQKPYQNTIKICFVNCTTVLPSVATATGYLRNVNLGIILPVLTLSCGLTGVSLTGDEYSVTRSAEGSQTVETCLLPPLDPLTLTHCDSTHSSLSVQSLCSVQRYLLQCALIFGHH